MSRIVVFLITVLSAIGFLGCAKYQTLPIHTLFDVSKAGNFYENNITVTKEQGYMFNLEYWEEREKLNQEYNALRKIGDHHPFVNTTVGKILGDGHGGTEEYPPGMKVSGSKIVLKLTVIPHQPLMKPIAYHDGEDPFFRRHTIPIDKSIVIISDLSTFPSGAGGGSPDNLYTRYSKSFSYMRLEEGDYTVRIENLKDVSDISEIQTHLYIGKTVLGK